mmetsp:Transcript_689/g.803  ORF Transcript_689/g.803 Transcript_689/m.803 type:complete len:123 (-) Transcript_689:58-426(-)
MNFGAQENEVVLDAESYLREHKILDLFEDLLTIVCHKQPENLEQFLVDVLKQRKEHGSRSIVYNEAELQNIFLLFDLKSEGHISKEQCKEALQTLANSEFHFKQTDSEAIPDKVDLFTFIKL